MSRNIGERPNWKGFVNLSCPYCLEAPFVEAKNRYKHREGCQTCGYKYEREAGYFTGAVWVIHYGFVGLALLVAGLTLSFLYPDFSDVAMIVVLSFLAVASFWFFPYSKMAWMVLDHHFHPLEEKDKLEKERA